MYVERDIKEKFEKLKKIYSCITIVGARQSGKTTFLKKRLEEINGMYLTMDDPDIREIFSRDIKLFEAMYLDKNKVFGLDEVQYCKNAGINIKYLVDKGYKLWITSSTETILNKDVLSYLVGRTTILKILPFSLNEFLRANNISTKNIPNIIKNRLLREHILFGGYPKVVLEKDIELKKTILLDLIDTLIYKDIMKTFSIEDENSLRRTIKYFSHMIGKIINYDNICKDLNISYKTLKKYLDALEKSYVLKIVKPFYTNKLNEISKSPKIYFIDTGLRNVISKNFNINGDLFENYIFSELLKKGYDIKYWRSKNKAEVDLILNDEIPVEVKIKPKIEKSLKSFIKKYRPKKAYVVCLDCNKFTTIYENCKIEIIDAFDFLMWEV